MASLSVSNYECSSQCRSSLSYFGGICKKGPKVEGVVMAPSLDPVAAGASDLRYSLFKTIYPTPANGQCITDHGHPGPVVTQ